MAIRQATTADLDALIGHASALFAEDSGTRDPHADTGWPKAHGRAYYAEAINHERSLVLVAETSTIVGFLIGRLQRHDPLRPGVVSAELESMFVAPPSRSRGVGRALAEKFHRWATERGTAAIMVTAYAGNDPALSFYRNLGYNDHKTILQRLAQHYPQRAGDNE